MTKDKETKKELPKGNRNDPNGIPLGPSKQVEVTLPKDLTVVLTQTAFSQLFGYAQATELEVSLLGIEKRRCKGFRYEWECRSFNPINHHCEFSIHFKQKGRKKQRDAFTYSWRLWTLPELRDLMEEAGFSRSVVFWEGDDGEGGGNGEFTPAEVEEECAGWVVYVAALA